MSEPTTYDHEKHSINVVIRTTPQEYQALRGAWDDRVMFFPLWDGEHVNQSSHVHARCRGQRRYVREMIQLLGVQVEDDGGLHS